jgi:hypothetical protein
MNVRDSEYFIELFRVMLDMCSDVMSDVRSNEIIELFGCYIRIFFC